MVLFFFSCLGKGSFMKNFLKLLLDHKVNLKIYQRIHIELPSIRFPRWFRDQRTLLPMQESQEMGLQPLSWEDHLEWKIPWCLISDVLGNIQPYKQCWWLTSWFSGTKTYPTQQPVGDTVGIPQAKQLSGDTVSCAQALRKKKKKKVGSGEKAF